MTGYIPDPTDTSQHTDLIIAETAQAEFRALKAYIAAHLGSGLPSGYNFFRRNVIKTGDFSYPLWIKGTNFGAPASGTFVADLWKYVKNTAATQNVARQTFAPSGTGAVGSLLAACVAPAAMGAANYAYLRHVVEGYDILALKGNKLTLSFWHAHTKVGKHCVVLRNATPDLAYIAEYQQITTNTWEFSQINIPLDNFGAAGFNFTNGIGLEVLFIMAAGTDYQTALLNAWQNTAPASLASANQVNNLDTAANNFYLALVQLEANPVATVFEFQTLDRIYEDVARYLHTSFTKGITPAQNTNNLNGVLQGGAFTGGDVSPSIIWQFPKEMRTIPSVSLFTPFAATTASQWGSDTGLVSTANARVLDIGTRSCRIDNAAIVVVAGGGWWYIHAVADARL